MNTNKDYVKGVLLILLSAFSFALMAAFVRLSGDVPFIQKTFFRNIIAFAIALCSILYQIRAYGTQSISIPGKAWPYLVLRAVCGTVGIFGNFYAVDHLILSDAAILNKMSPFYAVVFSYLLLKEKIRLVPAIAISVAFCGALLVARPSFDFSQSLPAIAGLLGGLGAGFAYSCVRKLGIIKCSGTFVVLFFSGFSSLVALPYLITNFYPMTARQTIFLLAAGLSAASGQFAITAAYYHAPASKISIFDFSQLIFSASLGYFLFSQIPDALSLIGYAVIVSMAVLNFIYNSRHSS